MQGGFSRLFPLARVLRSEEDVHGYLLLLKTILTVRRRLFVRWRVWLGAGAVTMALRGLSCRDAAWQASTGDVLRRDFVKVAARGPCMRVRIGHQLLPWAINSFSTFAVHTDVYTSPQHGGFQMLEWVVRGIPAALYTRESVWQLATIVAELLERNK